MPRSVPHVFDLFAGSNRIIQAPMAGVSTPALAVEVSEAGQLGSIAVGAQTPDAAAATIADLAAHSSHAVNVNVFCHAPPRRDPRLEARWLQRLAPSFETLGARVPAELETPYASFLDDDRMLDVLLDRAVQVVSFHFGMPHARQVRALHAQGILLMGTATSVREARQLEALGIDVIIAQGIEAGGHRGAFDPDADEGLGTEALVRALVGRVARPVFAAGGLMTGADIARALAWGAAGVQMGTAFIPCPESAASVSHRVALRYGGRTSMTRVISGRPARGFVAAWEDALGAAVDVPDYPVAYAAGRALSRASKGRFEVLWAGTGAAVARSMPAAKLVDRLVEEITAARA
ncbi:MAG TPA: nitronate monooxygenase [Pseudomonadales bacterium]|nr:nitronate monooxygenase [Pseudomonadales bacterium]